MKKLAPSLVFLFENLKPYFQAHSILEHTNFHLNRCYKSPKTNVVGCRAETVRRVFKSWTSNKRKALTSFVVGFIIIPKIEVNDDRAPTWHHSKVEVVLAKIGTDWNSLKVLYQWDFEVMRVEETTALMKLIITFLRIKPFEWWRWLNPQLRHGPYTSYSRINYLQKGLLIFFSLMHWWKRVWLMKGYMEIIQQVSEKFIKAKVQLVHLQERYPRIMCANVKWHVHHRLKEAF